MKSTFLGLRENANFSNFWFRNGFIILVISILVNHLFEPKNFPFNKEYEFPLLPILVSFFSGFIILFIAGLNFNHFKKKYFTEKISKNLLLRFLLSSLGYITLFYLILYYGLNGLINGVQSFSIYHLLKGLSISLLICTIAIVLLFSVDVYKLHKMLAIHGVLKVTQSGKITLVNYSDIAFIYSEHKIVHIVKTDGTTLMTDFTLNELEQTISEQSFYRANRQIILHAQAVEQVKSIENGKLSVLLKPIYTDKKTFEITISRYKKQEFMNWFQGKL